MHRLLTGPLCVRRVTVAIANLPSPLHGCTIAQLSDFHYDGLRLSDRLLGQAIAAVNAAQPALIALTGDFVTDDPTPIWSLAQHLRHLTSQYGIYAVLGNHDMQTPAAADQITQALTQAGVHVLRNAIAYPFGDEFPVVGLSDYWSHEFDPWLVDRLSPHTPRLVLSHNPDSAAVLRSRRVDLQL